MFCHGNKHVNIDLQVEINYSMQKNHILDKSILENIEVLGYWKYIRVFPKIRVPPNHPILIGFSIIFTIHFGVPLFLG